MRDAQIHHELGWVMIPPAILAAADLCMGEKVVCGRVIGLIGKKGYCFASNEWLGGQLGYAERTVEAYIGQLVKKGYLHREYGPEGKRDRRLTPIPEMTGKGIPIPEIAGNDPDPSREASLPEQGSPTGVSEESSETEECSPSAPPKGYLNLLTEKFAELRGVRPRGDSWKPIQQGMRAMVVAEGYTLEQVIGCMEGINKWGVSWTINTVRRWIADYAAGKLPSDNGTEPAAQLEELRRIRSRHHYVQAGIDELTEIRKGRALLLDEEGDLKRLRDEAEELKCRGLELREQLEAAGVAEGGRQ